MAGPITHTFFAQKALDTIAAERDPQLFIVGALFPDIRYLSVIKRADTHYEDVGILDVITEIDDFEAGVIFHSYIDLQREKYVKLHDVYTSIPENYDSSVALKMAEDLWTYSQLASWSQYADSMTEVVQQEELFDINFSKMKQWHDIHVSLFLEFNINTIELFLDKINIETSRKGRITAMIHDITDKGTAAGYMPGFVTSIESSLAEYVTKK